MRVGRKCYVQAQLSCCVWVITPTSRAVAAFLAPTSKQGTFADNKQPFPHSFHSLPFSSHIRSYLQLTKTTVAVDCRFRCTRALSWLFLPFQHLPTTVALYVLVHVRPPQHLIIETRPPSPRLLSKAYCSFQTTLNPRYIQCALPDLSLVLPSLLSL